MKTEKRIAQVGEYVTNGAYIARVDGHNGSACPVTLVAPYRRGAVGTYVGHSFKWDLSHVDVLTGKSALKAKIADLEMQLKAQPKVTYTVKGQDYADLEKELERSRTQEMLRSGERDSAVMAQDELRTELDNLKRRYEDVKRRAIDAEGKLASRRLDTSEQNLKDWIAAERAAANVADSRGRSLFSANQDLGNARSQLANVKAKLDEQHKVNGKLSAELGRLRAAVKDARKDIVSTVDRTLTAAVTGPKDEELRYYTRDGLTYRALNGSVTLWNWTGEWLPSGTFASEAELVKGRAIPLPGKPEGVA